MFRRHRSARLGKAHLQCLLFRDVCDYREDPHRGDRGSGPLEGRFWLCEGSVRGGESSWSEIGDCGLRRIRARLRVEDTERATVDVARSHVWPSLDAINGAIPPAAEALGRTAPYNEVISGLVRGKERRMGVRKS